MDELQAALEAVGTATRIAEKLQARLDAIENDRTFVAVKMDCFHPSATEVKLADESVLKLGSDWLVYQIRMGQKGILMPFNDKTQQHERP